MKKLTVNDIKFIQPYLDMSHYEGYNSNFVTMIMWDHEYHIEYEIHDHFMVMLHEFENRKFFAMPFCKEEYYEEALSYMNDYSKKNNFPFSIDCCVSSFIKTIETNKKLHNVFIHERIRDYDDYIYLREDLATLSGKRMQKRRNHYNSFKKQYSNYKYRNLDLKQDQTIIFECLQKWEDNKRQTFEIRSEITAIQKLIQQSDKLNVKSGGIFINNHLEGFLIASVYNGDMIQIHIEKGSIDINGIYPAILTEFLKYNYLDCKYINREEDLGIEGLRKSKMNLHPDHMVEKYRLHNRDDLKVKKANSTMKDELKNMWINAFEDETIESSNYYFNTLYKQDYTYVAMIEDEIISSIQIRPLTINNTDNDSYFILGVNTKKEYQGQGIMKYLVKQVINLPQFINSTIYLQAYHPEIYKSLGFYEYDYHNITKINKNDYHTYNVTLKMTSFVQPNELYELYSNYSKQFELFVQRDKEYFILLMNRLTHTKEHVTLFSNDNENIGYIIFEENNQNINITEFIIVDNSYHQDIISLLFKKYSTITINHPLNYDLSGTHNKIVNLMTNDKKLAKNKKIFINEVY